MIKPTTDNQLDFAKSAGANNYFHFCTDNPFVYNSKSESPYSFKVYIGPQTSIAIETGDTGFYFAEGGLLVHSIPGPATIDSTIMCTVIRGFTGLDIQVKQSHFHGVLPYINACSTRQLIHADRAGAPTLQLLKMGPWTKEQAHHVHSTPRVVYIAKGRGRSILGQQGHSTTIELVAGQGLILDEFCPHHFETDDVDLIALPLHIYSSIPNEKWHPMYLGTHSFSD